MQASESERRCLASPRFTRADKGSGIACVVSGCSAPSDKRKPKKAASSKEDV